ncbi:DUF3631 domain-containing protein [Nonomuraea sp. NPDC050536]|uniref:DUF3631 domain-containing protein n=1 Tax=Nonomuraea sp. NPDC050536 TaxID=3364366 RepID=UPI0037CA3F63
MRQVQAAGHRGSHLLPPVHHRQLLIPGRLPIHHRRPADNPGGRGRPDLRAKADGNEDLRGLLNAGHQRNRPAKRYDAAKNQVESIPTFAMAALAGIGAMPDTIEDRAVVCKMRRRAPNETTAPYRLRRDRPPLRTLAAQINQWLRADLSILEAAEPLMPGEDRAADTWEPLVIVADHAGGSWPERVRAAAVALTTEADEQSASSPRLRLLTDCRAAFGTDTALPTAALLERLKTDQESEWCEHGPAGLTAMKLGVLLREYDIRSTTMRFPAPIGQAKGYQRADFLDAWARYCPTAEPVPEADVVPLTGGSRTSRTTRPAAGQSGTATNLGTA